MFRVCKCFEFEAAHHLVGYDGACARLHGHSYKLEVILSGEKLNSQGMLLDFKRLKKMVDDLVIKNLDHQDLNEVFTKSPTAEHMARDIFIGINEELKKESIEYWVKVDKIRLWETSSSYAEYEREESDNA